MAKRWFDIVFAGLGLLLLSPLLLVISVWIKLDSAGPVLFRQERIGRFGVPFRIRKFRTMLPLRAGGGPRAGRNVSPRSDATAPGSATAAVATDASRLTPLGRFLRASSLDELPELYNVLVGDMSIVGPRPLLPEYLGRYNEVQARRHEVRPGITGWAQVNGRNAVSWDDRLAMDVYYVDHRSLALDLRVLGMTVGTVLGRSGVSSEGHATMEPFDPRGEGGSHKEDS